MCSSTPKLTGHLFRDGCLNRLESSIPANTLAPHNKKLTRHSKSIRLEWASMRFWDQLPCFLCFVSWVSDFGSHLIGTRRTAKKKCPRACKLLRGHCAHSVLNFLLDAPQFRRSWTCLERCSCFRSYFGRTKEYHRISKNFKTWNAWNFVE